MKAVPAWTKTIKRGAYIYVKTREEMEMEYFSLDDVPLSFVEGMFPMCNKKIYVNADMERKLKCATDDKACIFHKVIDGRSYNFSLGMLKRYKNTTDEENKVKSKEKYSLVINDKDSEIIEEMINKVDRNKLRTLFQIGTRKDGKVKILEEQLDLYLKRWAEAKYEFYLMFGKNLTIEKHIEEDMSLDLYRAMWNELKMKFPGYAFAMDYINYRDAFNNKFTYNSNVDLIQKYCSDIYTKGMKVTKFLSKLYDDDKFDIELSKLFQNKKVNTTVAMSIDPIDYLTMSMTTYSWQSCFHIGNGCYSNAAFSAMVDKVLIVCYTYNTNSAKIGYTSRYITCNSKKDRWFAYIDKTNSNYLIGGKQGNPSTEMIAWTNTQIRKMIKKEHNDIDWESTRINVKYPNNRYHHFQDGILERYMAIGNIKPDIDMDIDELTCPICGNKIGKNRSVGLICERCQNG